MDQNVGLFTIGQFAALHGIPKKTLMWYDEVGLFSPAVVRPNGYRCYTHVQSATLEAILMLRKLDVPIPRIRSFLDSRSVESLQALLAEQEAEVAARMAHLRAIRRTLAGQRREAEALLKLDTDSCRLVDREAVGLITLHTEKTVAWAQDVKNLVDEVQRQHLDNLYDASYGAMLWAPSLYQGVFDDYRGVFLESPRARAGTHVRPAGTYLEAYHRGDINQMTGRYEQLLAWARERDLTLTGYAYETVLNELAVQRPEDYITRIEVRVVQGDAEK